MVQLPSPGASFDLSVSAEDTRFEQGDSTYTVDLTGDLRLEIRGAQVQLPGVSVRTAVTRFDLTGTSQIDDDTPARITVALTDAESDPANEIKLVAGVPPKLEHTMVLHLEVTIEPTEQAADKRARGRRARREPLVLRTREPARLTCSDLDFFPPGGGPYRLTDPVELVRPDSDRVVATIEAFPVRVGN
ncbi:hypothetical protein AB0G32_13035 [Streptomyces sp. NPDC023723]|uniref:hypothetical protein n=1 Tax=Streptomyces sp. NPDC023723 TaxID=3154323 RepID=UPI00340B9596